MTEETFDFWKFLAGVGFFLLGMHQLENSLKEIAGKSFRKLLQKSTDSPWKGMTVGTLLTAILQSSSVVTLMVLAFLGAGVLNLRNSIGVVLGANLGTTVTAWIVVTLGFKLSIASVSMPFIGMGSLVYLFFSERPVLKNIGAFSVGFGLLFLGLDFMKTAIEAVADQIDFKGFDDYGLWVYLLIGIILTAMIQSSSATIVIVLSAISVQVIGLTEGAVLVIGANIGTTITVGLGALNGTADKKRLALAHFLFNVVTGILVFLFIEFFIALIVWAFNVRDPLIDLVIFNTIVKIIGVVLFFPFIKQLEVWLNGRFRSSEKVGFSTFIKNVSTKVPEAALTALEKDLKLTFELTVDFLRKVWDMGGRNKKQVSIWKKIIQQPFDLLSQYNRIKNLEDEMSAYHVSLQEENLSEADAGRLISLMLALRTMVYGAKDIKDILHNLKEMEDSDDLLVLELHQNLRNYTFSLLNKLIKHTQKESENMGELLALNALQHQKMIDELFQNVRKKKSDLPISTLTNVIRQLFSSLDNMVSAVIHWKQQKREVIDIEHIN